ncbi:hypothetical protein F4779DRAFT_398963 [Xylariaceae sp. FL0662B]|nr:hypothetical protein F4779DRAFT_398963 [Xylariaceae sp. FL0662B]
MTGHMTSTGRGGAGNIADASKSPPLQPADLETPTLKTPVITTGRGGSGNMAPNTDPVETRARQDVAPVERRRSHGVTHVGRGGAANIVKLDEEEAEAAKTAADSSAVEDGPAVPGGRKNSSSDAAHHGGLAAKAKEFFKRT